MTCVAGLEEAAHHRPQWLHRLHTRMHHLKEINQANPNGHHLSQIWCTDQVVPQTRMWSSMLLKVLNNSVADSSLCCAGTLLNCLASA